MEIYEGGHGTRFKLKRGGRRKCGDVLDIMNSFFQRRVYWYLAGHKDGDGSH